MNSNMIIETHRTIYISFWKIVLTILIIIAIISGILGFNSYIKSLSDYAKNPKINHSYKYGQLNNLKRNGGD